MGGWFKIALWKRVMLGLALGLCVGLALRYVFGADVAGSLANTWFKPFGDAFVRLIRMLIMPLIFSTLAAGVIAMGDPGRLRDLGVRAFSLYAVTTVCAVIMGLTAGSLFSPGDGVSLPTPPEGALQDVQGRLDTAAQAAPTVVERLLAVIPTNPIAAIVNGDILGVIFFSLIVGVGVLMLGQRAKAVADVLDAAAAVMIRITEMIMELAPFGVFALLTWVFATQDPELIKSFVGLTAVLYLVCGLQILVVYPIVVSFFAREHPLTFFRGVANAMTVAYSTSSSSATLPITIESLVKNLKVHRSNATGVAAIGSTMNMDGAAIYLSLVCLFALQASGQPITLETVGTIAVLATLGSIGAAGIPNGGLFMSAALLGGLGFSQQEVLYFVAVLFPFDRILDMMRTLTNVTGDATVAFSVDRMLERRDDAPAQTPIATASDAGK